MRYSFITDVLPSHGGDVKHDWPVAIYQTTKADLKPVLDLMNIKLINDAAIWSYLISKDPFP